MSATRTVRPTDLVALVSFDCRVYSNEARTWDQLGCAPEAPNVLGSAMEQWFSFATGRHTWISIQGQTIRGLISARRRGTRAAWEIDCLIAAATDFERVALDLFDQLSAGAIRRGAHKVFLRLDAGSDLLAPARKAGFVPYATERLLVLDAALGIDAPLPGSLMLRSRERADEHALFQLYNRLAPQPVRAVEAATFTEWQAAVERRSGGRGAADIVAERNGRVVAWLRTMRTNDAARFDVLVDPSEWPAAGALTGWALRDIGPRRPIYTTVASFALPVAERMISAGFQPAGDYELLAKRLAQPVRVGRPVRATVKPVATV